MEGTHLNFVILGLFSGCQKGVPSEREENRKDRLTRHVSTSLLPFLNSKLSKQANRKQHKPKVSQNQDPFFFYKKSKGKPTERIASKCPVPFIKLLGKLEKSDPLSSTKFRKAMIASINPNWKRSTISFGFKTERDPKTNVSLETFV